MYSCIFQLVDDQRTVSKKKLRNDVKALATYGADVWFKLPIPYLQSLNIQVTVGCSCYLRLGNTVLSTNLDVGREMKRSNMENCYALFEDRLDIVRVSFSFAEY